MPPLLQWIDDALAELERSGLRRQIQERRGPQSARIDCRGTTFLNFSSNDYLGLADERLAEAVVQAVGQYGWGAAASPLVTGRGQLHASLESSLAEFEGTEAALLFPSGYSANLGAITSLIGKGDVVFSDANNHASIIDGCRLSGAKIVVYPHGNADRLRELIADEVDARRRLIVTDGLFSMDGDLAPLPELAAIAESHEAMLMVDEAHATGVFGANGCGSCELLGVEDRVAVRVGTLSKALGSIGGFVVGSTSLIDWLANRARPFVYSTAMPEAAAAAAIEALSIVRREPERRRQLLEQAAAVRGELTGQGWDVTPSVSQIIPVRVGDPKAATRMSDELREQGFWVPAIRPPSVPRGGSLLRISLSYAHDDSMLKELIVAFSKLV
jgi:8-amino-7-oxononanoate synthase